MTDNFKIERFLRHRIQDALRDILCNGYIKAYQKEVFINPICEGIYYQYYYDKAMNKVYIEFQYTDIFRKTYSTESMGRKIQSYINSNMKRDEEKWPEILLIEDEFTEVCDSVSSLTPFVFTYWKSLSGNYLYIEDRAAMQMYAGNSYDVPDKLLKMYEEIKKLEKQYKSAPLSRDKQKAYIDEHTELYLKYSSDLDTFNTEVYKLNKKYGIITGANAKVPEIFEKYAKIFKKYCGKQLYSIANDTNRVYLEILDNTDIS